jgi:hypothetical protein
MKLAAVATALLLAACAEPPSEPLPQDLLQVWRTQAPGYRDRYFELREGWVVFGTGRYTIALYAIGKVTSDVEDGVTRYAIEYRATDGAILPLEVAYTPGNPASLQVGLQPDVWIPETHAHWLKKDASR